ncbi:MAG: UDP-N-acetylmuramate--L-alanine ligase, partial [Candidatus Doudnabacteria bacterium]|nr:UDP-N-acetylmuramate--L-alanine ligase [Candidatus Doudnabacteria bacterium]
GQQTFDLTFKNDSIGRYSLHVPGRHNLTNAMAAALMALVLGIDPDAIRKSLAEFPGIWRRFEKIGKYSGKIIISDYAHHPEGVEKTLQAAKQFYPNSKILTVFQPHQKNRTSKLYKEFVESLKRCEGLIITEIYSVVGREKVDIDISSKDLVNDLKPFVKDIAYAEDLNAAESLIKSKIDQYDIVLFMGAGDVDNLARKLIS